MSRTQQKLELVSVEPEGRERRRTMRHLSSRTERRVLGTKRELVEQSTKWSEANEVLVRAGDARGIGISL